MKSTTKIEIYIDSLHPKNYNKLISYICKLPFDEEGFAVTQGGNQSPHPRGGDFNYKGIKLEIIPGLIKGDGNKITKNLIDILLPKE